MTRRIEVLYWINEFMEKNQWSPSVREICDAFSWSSPATGQVHLMKLEKEGLIKRGLGPRQIRLTPAGIHIVRFERPYQ